MLLNSLVIRLRQRGHKHHSYYDIVVSYKYKRNRGDFVERLGFFNPQYKERFFFINLYRLGFWLNKGAILNISIKKHLSKFIYI